MPKVVHFEIPVDDPQRAVQFYERVFGWEIKSYGGPEDYWLVTAGAGDEMGINGAIMRRGEPVRATTNTVGVASVDESAAKVTEAGGKVLMAKTAIPGIGYFCYCADTEGNVFGIMQPDESAQ